MNYVQAATAALHDALRAEGKDPAESLTPDLERLYTLLVLTKGEYTSLPDVHDAWGVARAVERPDHPDLVPFDELSPEVQDYDLPFLYAIRAAAKEIAK